MGCLFLLKRKVKRNDIIFCLENIYYICLRGSVMKTFRKSSDNYNSLVYKARLDCDYGYSGVFLL